MFPPDFLWELLFIERTTAAPASDVTLHKDTKVSTHNEACVASRGLDPPGEGRGGEKQWRPGGRSRAD
ncbi:hypothetical protein EYF80_040484 [Liparis tanakae]|uniref:Uncharacterized protein n=1 Tax=Liparis tanakae TaxID=230148 RepID=A0A4Z2G722_9TELE|nr:hypothetical protein EYF80_040484 [Liparis tanakae]